ncbi:WD40-repeat-containing domain protein [Gymnopilus junonius]|uniref:WD40-repeat-containing domain protein n=1 Tax=Gymnopilus junonius TaxID=109634 RepID=A0A9P5NSW0_GYMJU|nr:WD40-repeat-containing domain protein [Gymnopilus junonius]
MASSSQQRTPFGHSHRSRPISRRAASSHDAHPYGSTTHAHHRATSSTAMPFAASRTFNTQATPPRTPPPQPTTSDPRFTRLFSTPLGSPFLTTSEQQLSRLEPEPVDYGRPPSPAPTADFSIIDMDVEDADPNPIPGSYPSSKFLSSTMSFPRGRPMHASSSQSGTSSSNRDLLQFSSPSPGPFKSLLPRLWDVLSSPGRTMLSFSNVNSTSRPPSPSSSRTPSPPPASARRNTNQSWYTQAAGTSGRNSPVYWNTSSNYRIKGKSKANGFLPGRTTNGSRSDLDGNINYSELPPLDGEEGELIDDEACFIDVRATDGIDILSLLPPELALHTLTLLCPPSLPSSSKSPSNTSISPGRSSLIINEHDGDPKEALRALLSCRLVSRTWCRLASDNAVWRVLFLARWNVDLRRAADPGAVSYGQFRSVRTLLGVTWDFDLIDIGAKAKRLLGLSSPIIDAPITSAPLRLDWRILYRERLELDLRWSDAPHVPLLSIAHPIGDSRRRMGGTYRDTIVNAAAGATEDVQMSIVRLGKSYEPKMTWITGHTDSVYCLEFDSRRIITGSRDRTIKVWSLRTGRLLGSFSGAHRGSVLCLKFEKDWDREWEYSHGSAKAEKDQTIVGTSSVEMEDAVLPKAGFMVSGSSDCTVCVWDLHLGDPVGNNTDSMSMDDDHSVRYVDDGEREIKADVRAILKGHVGGVLDLRIDDHWIVSCSKDAVIRVWNRETLELHRTLRGHEGPVNAVGLQSGKVVSASGDGKMILWDIESGERRRTFEGHDRGLACIEFKDDLIVSGSNDCKIKVWSASTGDCLRTLVGHEALVRALSFDSRTGRLVSASYDRSVKLWDLPSGKLVREFKGIHTSHIFDVKFDIARIVSTSHDQKIVILDFTPDLNTSLFV